MINAPNPGVYFQTLGAHAVAFREALQNLLNDAAYLQSMGGIAFLEAAPFSLSPTDAQLIMNTIGAVVPSNTTVQAVQAFINTTEPLWGGQ